MATTPIPALATVIVTGSIPVTVFAENPIGGIIQNPLLAADQDLSIAEPLYIDPTGNDPTTQNNGTTFALQPGQMWNVIPNQTTVTKANASSTGHEFAGVSW